MPWELNFQNNHIHLFLPFNYRPDLSAQIKGLCNISLLVCYATPAPSPTTVSASPALVPPPVSTPRRHARPVPCCSLDSTPTSRPVPTPLMCFLWCATCPVTSHSMLAQCPPLSGRLSHRHAAAAPSPYFTPLLIPCQPICLHLLLASTCSLDAWEANTQWHKVQHLHRVLSSQDSDLDLFMERLHQMNVIPNLLPVLHPSLDLYVTARLKLEHFEGLIKRNRFEHRVNTFKEYLTPRQTRVPTKWYANVFHMAVRLYTMLLVDPDVPDLENQCYMTFLHWLKPNIPLSVTHTRRILLLNTHTRCIPLHPQHAHRTTATCCCCSHGRQVQLTEQQALIDQSTGDSMASSAAHTEEVA
ncbi:hypothetical protein B0H14DRAFT_3440526 [Mycena olivaceomarginata]|nr:hypothetical protein B0H14DRAFT_3440526 [Mycena olivaceomarginata]